MPFTPPEALNVTTFAPNDEQRAAVGTGVSHPLSAFYPSIDLAKADYPHAVALSDELDWAVLQGAINRLYQTGNSRGMVYAPRGTYLLNRTVVRPHWVSLTGDGPMATELRTTAALSPLFDFYAIPPNVTYPNGKHGEMDIVDSMYYVNGNAVLADIWRFKGNDTITLQDIRAYAFTGTGVQIGSYNCRLEKVLLICQPDLEETIGVQMDSANTLGRGSNGIVLDQVWVQRAGKAGVRISADRIGSNGIVLNGCLFDRNVVGVLIDGGTPPEGVTYSQVWHVAVTGCRFEDNTDCSIRSSDKNMTGLTVLGSWFTGAPPYHIEVASPDAKIAFNSIWGHTVAGVRLISDARRTFLGFNSWGPGGPAAKPLLEDANPTRLLTHIDSFSGLASIRRYSAGEGTALTATSFALTGWGTQATVSGINANDSRGRFVVTASGTGFTANPTVRITFADGPWPTPPFMRVSRNGGAQPGVALEYTSTVTDATITFRGTPASGESYTIEYFAMQ